MTSRRLTPKWHGDYDDAQLTHDSSSERPAMAPEAIAEPRLVATTPTSGNLSQVMMGNPATGEVGWLDKWESHHLARRRCEFLANSLTADFRSSGMEGAVTFGGTGTPLAAAINHANGGPFIQIQTDTGSPSVGDSATARTDLGLFRWRWDPTCAFWLRTNNFINARYWFALTSVSLDQTASASVAGGSDKVVAWCIDRNAHGTDAWWAVTWDGTTLTRTNTNTTYGIPAADNNDVYMPYFEVDTSADEVRFGLYDWSLGANYGIIHTDSFTASGTDYFGMECVVEVVGPAVNSYSLQVGRFIAEHDG